MQERTEVMSHSVIHSDYVNKACKVKTVNLTWTQLHVTKRHIVNGSRSFEKDFLQNDDVNIMQYNFMKHCFM